MQVHISIWSLPLKPKWHCHLWHRVLACFEYLMWQMDGSDANHQKKGRERWDETGMLKTVLPLFSQEKLVGLVDFRLYWWEIEQKHCCSCNICCHGSYCCFPQEKWLTALLSYCIHKKSSGHIPVQLKYPPLIWSFCIFNKASMFPALLGNWCLLWEFQAFTTSVPHCNNWWEKWFPAAHTICS